MAGRAAVAVPAALAGWLAAIAVGGSVAASASGGYTIGPSTVSFIFGNEGYRAFPYDDCPEYRIRHGRRVRTSCTSRMSNCTIGYGHVIVFGSWCDNPAIASKLAPYRDGITQEQALALAIRDLAPVIDAINARIKPGLLDQTEVDGLASFLYNYGVGGLNCAGVARLINAGRFSEAARAFWTKCLGKAAQSPKSPFHKGVLARRLREARKFSGVTAGLACPVRRLEIDCTVTGRVLGGGGSTTPTSTAPTAPTTSPTVPSTPTIPSTPATTPTMPTNPDNPSTPTHPTPTPTTYTVTLGNSAPPLSTPDGRNLGYGLGTVQMRYTAPSGAVLTANVAPPDTIPVQVEGGTTVSLNATWDPTSYFVGWSSSSCDAQSPSCSFTVSSDTEVTGNFGVPTYVLTVTNANSADGYVSTAGDIGISCGDGSGGPATQCGPAEERSNVQQTLYFHPVYTDGTQHQVASVSGCQTVQALPAATAQCSISPSQATTIAVSWQ